MSSEIPVYAAFGLALASDQELAFERLEGARPDLSLVASGSFEPMSDAREVHRIDGESGDPELVICRKDETISITDSQCQLRFGSTDSMIRYHPWQLADGAQFEHLIERVVLPLYLMLTRPELVALHGSGVVIGGRGWVFIGNGGSGKSTTAHALLDHGATLLTDEVTLFDVHNGTVLPGAPVLHLWQKPGSVRHAVRARPVRKSEGKNGFRLRDGLSAKEVTPVGGIILLDPAGEGQRPELERLTGQAAALAFLAQAFTLFSSPADLATRRFRNVARLTRTVSVERLRFSRSKDGSPAHVDALLRRIESGG